MDITVDPGLVVTNAERTETGSRITIEVGPSQEGLWTLYEEVKRGARDLGEVPGIGHEPAQPFAGKDGQTWYVATLEIGQDVNEKLKMAALGVCRAWEVAQTELGSGDSRSQVEEAFQVLVKELESWTAYATREAEAQSPEDILEMIAALDDVEAQLPEDPYETQHAPSADELEKLL